MKEREHKISLVSACLVGIKCRYDGKSNPHQKLTEPFKKGSLIPICPEHFGGLSTPRPPAEIFGGDGQDVLSGKAKVIQKDGTDVTENFIRGAKIVLEFAGRLDVKEVVLKARSPSCGCGLIYDGSFSDELIPGDGVTTALLKQNGIKVKTEEDL